MILKVSPKLHIDLERDSYRLMAADDDPENPEIIAYNYDTVFALEAGVKQIIASKHFQTWLKKREGR